MSIWKYLRGERIKETPWGYKLIYQPYAGGWLTSVRVHAAHIAAVHGVHNFLQQVASHQNWHEWEILSRDGLDVWEVTYVVVKSFHCEHTIVGGDSYYRLWGVRLADAEIGFGGV